MESLLVAFCVPATYLCGSAFISLPSFSDEKTHAYREVKCSVTWQDHKAKYVDQPVNLQLRGTHPWYCSSRRGSECELISKAPDHNSELTAVTKPAGWMSSPNGPLLGTSQKDNIHAHYKIHWWEFCRAWGRNIREENNLQT